MGTHVPVKSSLFGLVDGQMKMTLTNADDTHDTVCKYMVEVQRMLRGRARSKHDKHETW
jgi:hypothetical protein